jgi:hypothetical protein
MWSSSLPKEEHYVCVGGGGGGGGWSECARVCVPISIIQSKYAHKLYIMVYSVTNNLPGVHSSLPHDTGQSHRTLGSK